ncbi:phage tail sheath family protein [Chitinophaga polysaccharea]|uniref:phage tail sheath family protein n=1 Tax=Chitinophaga TaxID=79328 RepID=UPI0014553ED7|nr:MULTISPECIES: phage tail sheath C-terminal domain-containing protein [Chitinophaga]NLR56897.1 phage tail sheath family protein [Chitinophaga polysaccharea]NLU93119.1 phage tail sheath family protein [Chitinophaga sp. Ak27]
MASTFMTPGVYIEEKNAFPSSITAVETAVPVFIGYTQKAERNGKSLVHKPTRITSFAEYLSFFGAEFKPKFTLADADPKVKQETFNINGKPTVVKIKDNNTAYFYNSIRLFFGNGGSLCYILSVGTYDTQHDGFTIAADDFIGSDTKPNVFKLLEKESEPTLIVMPDIIALGAAAYTTVYTQVLQHCSDMQSRFGIFDLAKQQPSDVLEDVVNTFREQVGVNALNYGAAYHPWLKTTIVQPDEIDFENLDATVDLEKLLPEPAAAQITAKFKTHATPDKNTKKNYHQSLKAASPTYVSILEEVRAQLNELPPSGAIAGIYTLVDNSRGVWKAPANVSVSMVTAPTVNISSEEQQNLNIDIIAGKSINVIRPFAGIGTLVWGARTLDGNSLDWQYINVRRTLIMIEQSIKLATRAYVFEPNDATTWITVKSMINNFLQNLWKQGALAGATPDVAYDVQVGIGTTMTPQDILEGKMLITVKVALTRPAEFIVITFQQQMQQS